MSYTQRPEDLPARYDPRGKVWLLLSPHIARQTWEEYSTNIPLWIPPPFYRHHLLVLDWAETRGLVKIAMLAASVPPVEQGNPDDYFIILGKSNENPGLQEVKLRFNPYWEDAVVGCYVRLDWICSVPLAILGWWIESWQDPWPGLHLMLQNPSLKKLQAYLERKEHFDTVTDLRKQSAGYAIPGTASGDIATISRLSR